MKLALLFALATFGFLTAVNCDCWWTGCQLHTWAVVGCGHYGRVQSGKKLCPGGYLYNCCTPDSAAGDVQQLEESQDYAGKYADCWWTGCQLSSWAVVGCEHYKMRTISKEPCPGGKKYHCCPNV